MRKKNQNSIEKLRAEFLPEALEIVEKPVAPLGNIIIWTVFAVMLAFIIWACVGRIDEVAVARGQITSAEGVQEIQATGNGTVTEVNVKEGDKVQKGDLLFTLDKEIDRINMQYSDDNIGILELKIELLNQMLAGKDITVYKSGDCTKEQLDTINYMVHINESDELSVKEYELEAEAAKQQYELEQSGLGIYEDKKEYLETQKDIQDKSQDLGNADKVELELLKDNYQYLQSEAEKYKKLYEAGAIAKSEWQSKVREAENAEKQIEIKEIEAGNAELSVYDNETSLEYQLTENEAGYDGQKGNISTAKSKYDAAVLNLEDAKKQRENKLLEMKEQYVNELRQFGVTAGEQHYEYENKDVKALYDGTVKTLHVDKEGAVVASSQVIAEILPDSEQLIVEAEVKNSDIGFVEVGQEADVKIDTYDYQKYGKIKGTVIYISPDAIENERMEKVYKANILIDEKDFETDSSMDVASGMECSIEIKTDKRRVIEFFLEPLAEALDNSFNVR